MSWTELVALMLVTAATASTLYGALRSLLAEGTVRIGYRLGLPTLVEAIGLNAVAVHRASRLKLIISLPALLIVAAVALAGVGLVQVPGRRVGSFLALIVAWMAVTVFGIVLWLWAAAVSLRGEHRQFLKAREEQMFLERSQFVARLERIRVYLVTCLVLSVALGIAILLLWTYQYLGDRGLY